MLESRGYDGVVFVPETRSGAHPDYDGQIEWELQSMRMSDVLLCWMPASKSDLPGLTTRVECGLEARSGKLIFGGPPGAYKTNYLCQLLPRYDVPVVESLEKLVDLASQRLATGANRQAAERLIPLEIWRAAHFQEWLQSQRAAGHRLVDVPSVEWVFRVPPGKRLFPLYIALHVSVAVRGENRVKSNEAVIIRPSISTVAAWCPAAIGDDDRFVLIKEYRAPIVNRDGFVYELPGGASLKPNSDPVDAGMDELQKETGLRLPRERFNMIARRQGAATMVANQHLLLAARLTAQEMDELARRDGAVYGEASETERTYLCVRTRRQIIEEGRADFVTLGQISLIH